MTCTHMIRILTVVGLLAAGLEWPALADEPTASAPSPEPNPQTRPAGTGGTAGSTGKKSRKGILIGAMAAAGGGVAAAVLATRKDDSPSGGSRVSYDGTWSGSTSQGRPISFTVGGNAITAITISYSLSGNCNNVPSGSTTTFTTPVAINGNSFTTSGSTGVSGSFSSANAASGTFNVTFSGVTPIGCSSSASGTWTASK